MYEVHKNKSENYEKEARKSAQDDAFKFPLLSDQQLQT